MYWYAYGLARLLAQGPTCSEQITNHIQQVQYMKPEEIFG
jgi:hypothetical protein